MGAIAVLLFGLGLLGLGGRCLVVMVLSLAGHGAFSGSGPGRSWGTCGRSGSVVWVVVITSFRRVPLQANFVDVWLRRPLLEDRQQAKRLALLRARESMLAVSDLAWAGVPEISAYVRRRLGHR